MTNKVYLEGLTQILNKEELLDTLFYFTYQILKEDIQEYKFRYNIKFSSSDEAKDFIEQSKILKFIDDIGFIL